jgi:hypothetical protein
VFRTVYFILNEDQQPVRLDLDQHVHELPLPVDYCLPNDKCSVQEATVKVGAVSGAERELGAEAPEEGVTQAVGMARVKMREKVRVPDLLPDHPDGLEQFEPADTGSEAIQLASLPEPLKRLPLVSPVVVWFFTSRASAPRSGTSVSFAVLGDTFQRGASAPAPLAVIKLR